MAVMKSDSVMSMSLTARNNLCINNDVAGCGTRTDIDNACRARTANFVRKQNRESPRPGQLSCDYFEKFQEKQLSQIMPRQIYNLEDLKQWGRESGVCPYFAAREGINIADIVIYSQGSVDYVFHQF